MKTIYENTTRPTKKKKSKLKEFEPNKFKKNLSFDSAMLNLGVGKTWEKSLKK